MSTEEELARELSERATIARAKAQSLIDELARHTGDTPPPGRRLIDAVEVVVATQAEFGGEVASAPESPWLSKSARGTSKPALPDEPWGRFPRLMVDPDHPDVDRIVRLAVLTADDYTYDAPGDVSPADIRAGGIREALLHLLELGLIDIDAERLHAADGFPTGRMLRR